MTNMDGYFWQNAMLRGGLHFMQMQNPEPENVVLDAEYTVVDDIPAIENKNEI